MHNHVHKLSSVTAENDIIFSFISVWMETLKRGLSNTYALEWPDLWGSLDQS